MKEQIYSLGFFYQHDIKRMNMEHIVWVNKYTNAIIFPDYIFNDDEVQNIDVKYQQLPLYLESFEQAKYTSLKNITKKMEESIRGKVKKALEDNLILFVGENDNKYGLNIFQTVDYKNNLKTTNNVTSFCNSSVLGILTKINEPSDLENYIKINFNVEMNLGSNPSEFDCEIKKIYDITEKNQCEDVTNYNRKIIERLESVLKLHVLSKDSIVAILLLKYNMAKDTILSHEQKKDNIKALSIVFDSLLGDIQNSKGIKKELFENGYSDIEIYSDIYNLLSENKDSNVVQNFSKQFNNILKIIRNK